MHLVRDLGIDRQDILQDILKKISVSGGTVPELDTTFGKTGISFTWAGLVDINM